MTVLANFPNPVVIPYTTLFSLTISSIKFRDAVTFSSASAVSFILNSPFPSWTAKRIKVYSIVGHNIRLVLEEHCKDLPRSSMEREHPSRDMYTSGISNLPPGICDGTNLTSASARLGLGLSVSSTMETKSLSSNTSSIRSSGSSIAPPRL